MGGRLRAKQMGALRTGRHGDGGTLFLVVEPGGRSRHWVQRLTVHGKRRDLGLGGYPYVGLAEARAAAFANRQLARRGGDPTAVLRQSRAPTFRTACERVEAGATWKGMGAENRRRALERYCGSIMDRGLDQIRRADVIAILSPVMAEKRATGSKLHGWIRGALAWGVAREHIEFNVADGIGAALPSARKTKKHHPALPYSEVGAALEAIAGCTASEAVKLCLRFIVLTAVRSGEAR
ncbi:MAG: Arm DNA-binding domain-containing protein, partial [Acidobacteria bacterium]|nr:Arm DNA-binding domain-containing protein [Acidobacteriota bacterium]